MSDRELKIFRFEGGTSFAVHLSTGAKKNEIQGVFGTAFKIRLKALPVEGRANEALIQFLAERLKVKRQQVEIVSGHTIREKMISVTGISPAEVEGILLSGIK